jgi:single-strand DNA-binding protein
MASLNKVIIIGNLTRDPELKYTPNGTGVCDISVAVNRTWTDNGEKKEEVTFVDVTLWGKIAELAAQYLQKGRSVMVEGRLSMDTWDDKATGQKRSKMKVTGENVQFLDSKGNGSGQQQAPQQRQQAPSQQRPLARQQPKQTPLQQWDNAQNDAAPWDENANDDIKF